MAHHRMVPQRRIIFRTFSTSVGALFGLDLSGRAILYGQHNAFVHDFHRSIFIAEISDAIWSQQNEKTGHSENYIRVVAVDCNEPAAEFDVFKGN